MNWLLSKLIRHDDRAYLHDHTLSARHCQQSPRAAVLLRQLAKSEVFEEDSLDVKKGIGLRGNTASAKYRGQPARARVVSIPSPDNR